MHLIAIDSGLFFVWSCTVITTQQQQSFYVPVISC